MGSGGALSLIECCWLVALGRGWQFPTEVKLPIPLGTRNTLPASWALSCAICRIGTWGALWWNEAAVSVSSNITLAWHSALDSGWPGSQGGLSPAAGLPGKGCGLLGPFPSAHQDRDLCEGFRVACRAPPSPECPSLAARPERGQGGCRPPTPAPPPPRRPVHSRVGA